MATAQGLWLAKIDITWVSKYSKKKLLNHCQNECIHKKIARLQNIANLYIWTCIKSHKHINQQNAMAVAAPPPPQN